MMYLRPWNLWTREGAPQPGTEEIVATLERVIAKNPNHPGALHLYIHAVEASREPGRAEAAADRLRSLMPGAGHLVHMPAHIYWRVGRYADAVPGNVAAADADRAYFKTATPSPIYRGLYYPHNIDFIWQSASMQGRSTETIRAAREFAENAPLEMIKAMPDMETAPVAPIVALVRFGRWDEVLAYPAPPREWPYTSGVWRYARGLAFNAKGQAADATRELRELEGILQSVPPDRTVAFFFRAKNVLQMAANLLAGEIAAKAGDAATAERLLRAAVAEQDTHWFTEPPPWYFPVRQALGAVLLQAGRASDAEQVYREDLKRNPGNGWSLFGLAQSLKTQGIAALIAQGESQLVPCFGEGGVQRDRAVERLDGRLPILGQARANTPVVLALRARSGRGLADLPRGGRAGLGEPDGRCQRRDCDGEAQSDESRNDRPGSCHQHAASIYCAGSRRSPGSGAARGQQSLDGPEVGLRIHADRGRRGLDDDDGDPVLDEPELLELLRELERRRRQSVERVERRLAIGVEAGVLPAHDAGAVSIVGDRILREVEGAAVHAADDLVHVRVRQLVGTEADLERGHLGVGTLAEGTDEEPDVVRRDQRLVPLDVHVDVGGARLRDLPDPVGPGRVLGRGHDRRDPELRARSHDLLGIRSDQQVGEVRRLPGRFVHSDDQGLAAELPEDLARQARGLEARRNDAQDAEPRVVAHGKARRVRSWASRASPPAPGANGTITSWVSPARVNSAMRSRQNAAGPTTPRPSRNRGDTCLTAPARSPARHAALTASTSSAKPAPRKKLA